MLVVSGLIGRGGTDLNWHTLILRAGVYPAAVDWNNSPS